MEELKKLVDVLERKGKASASAILDYSDSESLETRLYQHIKEGRASNEIELLTQLYGNADKVNAFRMLKSRVKRKLYNQLFFLDIEDAKVAYRISVEEFKCRKILYLADALRRVGEVKLAKQHLQKVLEIAGKMQLIDSQIDALKQLRFILAENEYNRKAFNECVAKLEHLHSQQEIERRAEATFYDIRFDLKLGVEASRNLLGKLSGVLDDLKSYWAESGLSSVFRRYHQLRLIYFEVNGDLVSNINYIKEAFEQYYSGKIHRAYFSENYNKYLLAFAYLRSQQFKEGLEIAEALRNELTKDSSNWFAHMENYFLLAVHSKNYPKAEALISEVLNNKYLQETTTFSQERWLLYYKFLNYISGYTISTAQDKVLRHVPQDKKGFNVWNLIIEFLQVLEKQQPELLEREMERIRKFSSKYLNADEDTRTKLFLKLLQLVAREFADPKTCRRKGLYLFKKLQQTPVPGIAYAETEIVPFEHLWEIILKKLTS